MEWVFKRAGRINELSDPTLAQRAMNEQSFRYNSLQTGCGVRPPFTPPTASSPKLSSVARRRPCVYRSANKLVRNHLLSRKFHRNSDTTTSEGEPRDRIRHFCSDADAGGAEQPRTANKLIFDDETFNAVCYFGALYLIPDVVSDSARDGRVSVLAVG